MLATLFAASSQPSEAFMNFCLVYAATSATPLLMGLYLLRHQPIPEDRCHSGGTAWHTWRDGKIKLRLAPILFGLAFTGMILAAPHVLFQAFAAIGLLLLLHALRSSHSQWNAAEIRYAISESAATHAAALDRLRVKRPAAESQPDFGPRSSVSASVSVSASPAHTRPH